MSAHLRYLNDWTSCSQENQFSSVLIYKLTHLIINIYQVCVYSGEMCEGLPVDLKFSSWKRVYNNRNISMIKEISWSIN